MPLQYHQKNRKKDFLIPLYFLNHNIGYLANLPTDKQVKFKNLFDKGDRAQALELLKDSVGETEFKQIAYFFKRYDTNVIGFNEHLKEG